MYYDSPTYNIRLQSVRITPSYIDVYYIYILLRYVYGRVFFSFRILIDTVVRPADISQNDHCVCECGGGQYIKIIKVAITRTRLGECFFIFLFFFIWPTHGRRTPFAIMSVGRRLRTRYTRFTVITAPYLAYYFI